MFFVFKLDVHIKVYKLIKKKHQQDLFKIVQNFEKKKKKNKHKVFENRERH